MKIVTAAPMLFYKGLDINSFIFIYNEIRGGYRP